MAGFGLQSIIVVILGVIILSILVLRIRTSSSSPSQVSTIFQSSQNNDLVDNPELLAVNNNVSPLPVSSPSFSPLSGMDYFGRNWNWPLVVIILMIAVFLIWLIGYALMGKTPTGNTTNNNNNNNSISNNNSKLTATINTHTNSSSTFTTTTSNNNNNNNIPSTFTSTINNSTTTISASPTPVIISSATSTITPSVPSFTSTPNPSFTPIPPVPSNPPINSSSSSSSSTINRTSSSYLGQTISSVGTSTFNVPPDQIQLTLHLEATAPSDLEARDSINALLSDLRTALQQSGVPSADIQIGNISILPSYPNSLLNLISATSQESQNNQVSLPSSLYQNASSLSSPSYSSSDNNNNNNNNNRRKKRIKQNKKEEDQENNNNMYSSSNCTTPSPYYQHGGINSGNTQQNNFTNLINPQYTNSTVSIPPTAVTAIAEVQVYTLMNRVNLNALLSAAANNSSQFNVIFSLSDANQSQQKATALLLARQNATDNAFVQAQNLRLQLGGMIDEYVAPDGVSIYPIVVNNSQDISSLFNNEKSVKVVATVNNTYAIS